MEGDTRRFHSVTASKAYKQDEDWKYTKIQTSKMLDNSENLINSDDRPGSDRSDVHMSAPPKIGDKGFNLMTESEVIQFLRIPEISNSKDYHNVIEHLKRVRGLPRIHICRKALYPKKAVLQWLEKQTGAGK